MVKIDVLITAKELAGSLRLSVGTIYNKVSRREIPFVKVGRCLRFSKDQLQEWIKNGGKRNVPVKKRGRENGIKK